VNGSTGKGTGKKTRINRHTQNPKQKGVDNSLLNLGTSGEEKKRGGIYPRTVSKRNDIIGKQEPEPYRD